MLEFEWPWAFALLPLPLLVWWLVPPRREQQTSVQVPFFDDLAQATGQTPQVRKPKLRAISDIQGGRTYSVAPGQMGYLAPPKSVTDARVQRRRAPILLLIVIVVLAAGAGVAAALLL